MGVHGVGQKGKQGRVSSEARTEKASKADKPAKLGATKTSELPGHLPKVTKLDVEALAKKPVDGGVTSARIVAEVPTGMPSSGLVHLPTGETLAISDNTGVCEIRSGEEPRVLFKLKDGEGITVDSKGKYVYVVEEEARRVRKLEVRRDDKGRVALRDTDETRKLPRLKTEENSGWEGISFLPKGLAGGKTDYLVCVHEASPRRIGLYALPDLDEGHTLKLPKAAKDLLPDLADVAVHPETGHLFVVSDQARTIVELAVVQETKAATQGLLAHVELKVISSVELPLSGRQKPEALHFDEKGRLWVGLDNEDDDKKSGKALVLELDR
jgi:SdiA-regulated